MNFAGRLLYLFIFAASAQAEENSCRATPVEKTAARTLAQITAVVGEPDCHFGPAERATFEAFRPVDGVPERVEDPLEELRFERPRLRASGYGFAAADCAGRRAVLSCAERYGEAMRGLEDAIAFAAIKDPAVLAMARRLAKRLALVIKARATRDVLGDVTRPPTSAERERIERLYDERLAKAYGACTVDQAGCLGSACAAGDRACAERQAGRLREGLERGNLREAMFFLYTSNGVLTDNASRPAQKHEDPAAVAAENQATVADLNRYFRSQGQDWQLTNLPVKYQSPFILARTGLGADNNRMRDWRTLEAGQTGCVPDPRRLREAPVPSLAMIPLSPRETELLAERLRVSPGQLSDQPLPWHSGESCFALKHEITDPKFAKYNALLKNTRDARVPMLTGISGTTDSLIGLGRALGLTSREDFELLRGAALGWLVSSRDHSVHEIMTATGSFKEFAPYRFRPDAYKTMMPSRPGFARDVEAYQRARGLPLPAEVLRTCLTAREARAGD